jgi:hypothetical protein
MWARSARPHECPKSNGDSYIVEFFERGAPRSKNSTIYLRHSQILLEFCLSFA